MKHALQALGLTAILAMAASGACAQEVYGKIGFLGAGLGYAHGINSSLTVRGDFTSAGSYSHDGSSSGLDYEAKLRNNQATAYLDWFPFESGFRLTAGLGLRSTRITADARPDSTGTVTIGDTTVGYGAGDSAHAKVEMPRFAPYLGLGWGHNVGRDRKTGFGFVADLGVYFGKPDVSFSVNDSLRTKLDLASGGNADREIRRQRADIQDDADKLKVFPALYVGVSYTF